MCRLQRFKKAKIFKDLLTHGDKSIAGFQKILGERLIAYSLFVRNNIIGDTYHLCMFILFDLAKNSTQGRADERQPKTDDNEVGLPIFYSSSNLYPIDRINRIY